MKLARRIAVLAGLIAALASPVALAQADKWPTKPVKLLVTFPPGGSSDIIARLIAAPLGEKLGQPVIVDNRPGAGGTIGAAEVARAPADGYTLLVSNSAPITISPFMLDKSPYDPVKGFNHIAFIGSVPNVFVVNPSVPAKNMNELIAWIKTQPKGVSYGSGGVGSIGHIVGETFAKENGLRMEHVGYRGSSPMHTDLLGGTILMAIDTLPQNVPYMKDGKLRGLAVTSATRAAMSPDTPTVVELKMPKLVADNFIGISAPAGTPQPIVDKLYAAMTQVLADPTVQKRLEELGMAYRKMTPPEFNAFVAAQAKDWEPAVKASGARLN